MAKRKQPVLKKSRPGVTEPDLRSAQALSQSVSMIVAELPTTDPSALWRAAVAESGGCEADILATLSREKSRDVLVFIYQLSGLPLDKTCLKEIKRAIYRLEQSGLRLEEALKPKGQSILKPSTPREPSAWLTPYDSGGIRSGILSVPGPFGGYEVAVYFMAQDVGLMGFEPYGVSAGQLDRLVGGVREMGLELIPATPAHARFVMNEAALQAQGHGLPLPEGFQDFMALTSGLPRQERPIIHDLIPEPGSDQDPDEPLDLGAVAERLLAHRFFEFGFDVSRDLDPYLDRLDEVAQSPLVLTPAQKNERRMAILDEAGLKLFAPDRVKALVRKVEEMAFLLWLTGERDLARAALATALDLARSPETWPGPRFVQTLWALSLRLALDESGPEVEEAPAAESSGTGLILP